MGRKMEMYQKPQTPQHLTKNNKPQFLPLHFKDENYLVSSHTCLLSSFTTKIILEFSKLYKDFFYQVFSKN